MHAAIDSFNFKRIVSTVLCICIAANFISCSSDSGRRRYSGSNSDDEPVETEDVIESVETSQTALSRFDPDFTFSTTDRNGVSYSERVFSENELTMINIFEPWCGPCVNEMEALERLYEDYSDSGLMILGMYSDTSVEGDLDIILSQNSVSYPILHYTSDFSQFQSGYVPTTIFIDSEGHVVYESSAYGNTYIGARDYDTWASIVENLMES